jgi:hypothetical protein
MPSWNGHSRSRRPLWDSRRRLSSRAERREVRHETSREAAQECSRRRAVGKRARKVLGPKGRKETRGATRSGYPHHRRGRSPHSWQTHQSSLKKNGRKPSAPHARNARRRSRSSPAITRADRKSPRSRNWPAVRQSGRRNRCRAALGGQPKAAVPTGSVAFGIELAIFLLAARNFAG